MCSEIPNANSPRFSYQGLDFSVTRLAAGYLSWVDIEIDTLALDDDSFGAAVGNAMHIKAVAKAALIKNYVEKWYPKPPASEVTNSANPSEQPSTLTVQRTQSQESERAEPKQPVLQSMSVPAY